LLHNRVPTWTCTDDGWMQEPSLKYSTTGLDRNVYNSRLDRENIVRQALSLFIITWLVDIIGQAQQRVIDIQTNVTSQAIGYTSLFGIRIHQLHLCFRQGQFQAPQIPQKSGIS
jgi:hypothetical protein